MAGMVEKILDVLDVEISECTFGTELHKMVEQVPRMGVWKARRKQKMLHKYRWN